MDQNDRGHDTAAKVGFTASKCITRRLQQTNRVSATFDAVACLVVLALQRRNYELCANGPQKTLVRAVNIARIEADDFNSMFYFLECRQMAV